ncbi:hypothetical protein ACAG39_08795 [Caldicellulosiruptoraceae bacterium PP1]
MKYRIKYYFLFLIFCYFVGIILSINIFLSLSQNSKETILNSIKNSFDIIKNGNNNINDIVIFSIFSTILLITPVLLSYMNKYLQIANIIVIIYKGYIFGFTTFCIFYLYKLKALMFFITYILLKELIILIILVILILNSFSIYFIKEKMYKKSDFQNKLIFSLFVSLIFIITIIFDKYIGFYSSNF